ncbi:hypothetical protein ABD91_20480 [Lysinibacillus sphaericus]|uniref:hypothetical protein n=1 Tax=Lysinibacillus sphaericus TaxID=1421 RepID=UPI0018CCAFEE|nr:hypothetical protein [Lysinibacillus sphaericus]MBG9693123.1 hypothetical protein [Lysinibacillus sphaericus]
MGSTTFIEEGVGRDAEEIFKRLVDESREYHGTRHYTGGICEKEHLGLIIVEKPKGKKVSVFIDELLEKYHSNSDPTVAFKTGEFRDVQVNVVKKVKEKKYESEGAKKWITYYTLYVSNWVNGVGPSQMKIFEDVSKIEAKKYAKKYAKEHNKDVYLAMEKRLEVPKNKKPVYTGGIQNVLSVFDPESEPKTVRMPVWNFVGWASI